MGVSPCFHNACLPDFLGSALISFPSELSLLPSHCFPGFSKSAFVLISPLFCFQFKRIQIPLDPSRPFATLEVYSLPTLKLFHPLCTFSYPLPFIGVQITFSPCFSIFSFLTSSISEQRVFGWRSLAISGSLTLKWQQATWIFCKPWNLRISSD